MGNPFKKPKPPPPDPAVEAEIKRQADVAEAEKVEAEKEAATQLSKKRRGLIGSRSLFGRAGGRGYFDEVS